MKFTHTADRGGITVGVLEDQHGHLWFFAHEIAQAYGSHNTNDVTRYVRDKYKSKINLRTMDTPFERVHSGRRDNGIRSIISEYGLYEFIMRGNTAKAEQFREWVVEELLPAIRRGEAISTDGTPMQDVQDMTGVAALVGRIEILEGTLGELLAELKSVYEDRDYWRTVAEGLSKTEVHIYGDPLMSDLINLR